VCCQSSGLSSRMATLVQPVCIQQKTVCSLRYECLRVVTTVIVFFCNLMVCGLVDSYHFQRNFLSSPSRWLSATWGCHIPSKSGCLSAKLYDIITQKNHISTSYSTQNEQQQFLATSVLQCIVSHLLCTRKTI
jgi:hypothetical protein